jgi:hypothetical protein
MAAQITRRPSCQGKRASVPSTPQIYNTRTSSGNGTRWKCYHCGGQLGLFPDDKHVRVRIPRGHYRGHEQVFEILACLPATARCPFCGWSNDSDVDNPALEEGFSRNRSRILDQEKER